MSILALLAGLVAAAAVFLWVGTGPSHGRVDSIKSKAGSNHGRSAMVTFGVLVSLTITVGILTGSPLMAVGTPAVFGIGWTGRTLHFKTRTARRQLALAPVVVELIAQRLRAGRSVLSTLRTLDKEQAEAVGVHTVVPEVDAGASLVQALSTAPGGLLRAALVAVELSGGAGAAAVERLADRLRVGAGVEATARAQSGQQLASASLMALLPPVIALLYALSDRHAAEFYIETSAGALVLVLSMALSGVSWLWMRWILQGRSLR
ncbi:MAG: hypothetical protein HKN03_17300 [Acidimicrobiales bacterium]|nr:hypothetical protein [Acidimicrobiales bacterium]